MDDHSIKQSIAYYSAVWLVAFAAGCCRRLRDSRSRHFGNVLSVGAVAGFTGLSVVALLIPGDWGNGISGIGVASLVGICGKELNELIVQRLVQRVLGKD